MDFLRDTWNKIKNSSTIARWIILLGGIFVLMLFAGFELEEFRVTLLLLWYGLVSTAFASLLTYIYGKINYHKPQDQISAIGQIIIFASTMMFSGFIILGTYIAQYN